MEARELPIRTGLPIPISERFEFVSENWLSSARNFLQTKLDDLDQQPPGRFAAVESYINAPPHLKRPSNIATVHIVIEEGIVDVGYGDVPEPTFRVSADYNQALVIGTAVYEQLPDRQMRLRRELAHRHGDVFQVTGEGFQTVNPQILGVLSGLHDHLAKRTIGNPDISHKLQYLDVEQRVRDIEEDGYTVFENAISEAFVDELNADFDRLIAQNSRGKVAAMLMSRGPMWEEIATHPQIHAVAQHLLGSDCNLGQSIAFRKRQGVDTHQIHNDPPHPFTGELCCNVTTVWALSEFDDEAGPTVVVPGSHKENRPPDNDAKQRAVKVTMSKGSVAMWHGSLWHGTAIRERDGERTSLHNTYLRNWVRTWDNYLEIDPEILERNSPTLTTLAGIDDLYGKNTYEGIDFQRFSA